MINASLQMQMGNVLHAIRDMIWSMELAYSLMRTRLFRRTQDAENGTGTIKLALLAQKIGSSIKMEPAFQSAINARQQMTMDFA